jgi:hypothetical protein
VEVVGHPVILDDAPVFRLVLGHDAIGTVVDSLQEMSRFPRPHVLRAVRVNHCGRNTQTDRTIDTALATLVMFIVGVEGVDVITKEVGFLLTRMREEGFLFAQLQGQLDL